MPELTDLPVEEVIYPLRGALRSSGSAVLVAPPGAGKTTVVPVRLLAEPWLEGGRIVMLEPRRLAARAAAHRIAQLLDEPLGRRVGYRTRDERVGGRDVRIEVITEGILVRRLQRQPDLAGTALVIFDEVHERNLTTDLSLALALDARDGLRPDLRILAMSATVDAERVATVLAVGSESTTSDRGGDDQRSGDEPEQAPIIVSSGRQHPVDVLWHPPEPRDRPENHLARTVSAALHRDRHGDVLVFLPGAAEIDRARRALRSVVPSEVAVLPLHGSLPLREQDRALAPSAPGGRRIVVATDIAESSLTVDGVRIVVDAGRVRAPRFDPSTGLTRLVTEPASQAAADQRAGRAGRLGPGVTHRLWSESEHRLRSRFAVPEIEAVDLAGMALELAVWGAGPDELSLIDRPPAAAWAEAVALLGSLDLVDGNGRPTGLGRAVADLPLHPRLAHMVVRSRDARCGWTGALLAALLDGRDILRGRRDDRPCDLVERMRLVQGDSSERGMFGVEVGRDSVAAVRHRAREIARRARIEPGRGGLETEAVAELVAGAHPDRVAQARGGGRFRFRDGGGGFLPDVDPLADAEFLAVAEVDAAGAGGRPGPGRRGGDGRIRTAAALDRIEVEALFGSDLVVHEELVWDEQRDELRERRTERIGALVMRTDEKPPRPGPATVTALLERLRNEGPGAFGWTAGARRFRDRLIFAAGVEPDRWPSVDDDALMASLPERIGPFLSDATSMADVRALDLRTVLGTELSWEQRQELDRRFPRALDLANGSRLELDWSDPETGPRAGTRVQQLYGLGTHPAVDGGAVPVLLELLSPADRPIQITADLPGFWSGTWSEVRREMAGRYPKHHWPDDPASAGPPRRQGSRRRDR